MSGQGISVTKISKRYGADLPPTEKEIKYSDKSVWHRYSGKPPNGKTNKMEANRSGDHVEHKSFPKTITKNSQISSSTNKKEKSQCRSETENFDSVGVTLSDGIKSMKMFPILNSYQEIDAANRSYLWKIYLESLGGKYVIIDKKEENKTSQILSENDNIIRKVEI